MPEFPSKISGSKREYDMQSESENTDPVNSEDVDLSVLLDFEQSQGEDEPDLIVELIDLYLEDAPRQLSAIKDSILVGDRLSLKRAAHSFKGSSATLGVKGIAVLCEELEQADFSKSFQESDAVVNRLEQTFARVCSIFLTEKERRG